MQFRQVAQRMRMADTIRLQLLLDRHTGEFRNIVVMRGASLVDQYWPRRHNNTYTTTFSLIPATVAVTPLRY